jgi:hypothetical protein
LNSDLGVYMSSYIRKYDLVEVSEYTSYLAITDNIHIFNKFISIMKSSVIVYEGLYALGWLEESTRT